MRRTAPLVLFTLLLSACQGNQLVRVAPEASAPCAPRITGLVDLGTLPLPDAGRLDPAASDGRFVAGEWVAVQGECLSAPGARVRLDRRELPVAGALRDGGLLFRLPADLAFRHAYTVRVETPAGADARELRTTHTLALSDPRTDRLVLWRTSASKDLAFDEEPAAVPLPGGGPSCFSAPGGLLYAAAAEGRRTGKGDLSAYPLKTVDLGARTAPAEVSSVAFESRWAPVSLAVTPDGGRALVLTAGEVLTFDLARPDRPRFLSRTELPAAGSGPARFRDLVVLDGGRRAAALDVASNRVTLLDLSDPARPAPTGSFAVGPASDTTYTIALAPDPAAPDALWVLTGLNALQVRQRLSRLWGSAPDNAPLRAALVHLRLADGALRIERSFPLPEHTLPLALCPDENGDALVSAVSTDLDAVLSPSASLDGVFSLLEGLKNSVFFAKIYRIDPRGGVTIEARSTSLFLALARAGGGPLLSSTFRLAPSYFLPSLKVRLSVDVVRGQSLPVRDLTWTTLIPPYPLYELALQ